MIGRSKRHRNRDLERLRLASFFRIDAGQDIGLEFSDFKNKRIGHGRGVYTLFLKS